MPSYPLEMSCKAELLAIIPPNSVILRSRSGRVSSVLRLWENWRRRSRNDVPLGVNRRDSDSREPDRTASCA